MVSSSLATFTQYIQGAKLSETVSASFAQTNQLEQNLLRVSSAVAAFIPRDPLEVGADLIHTTLLEAGTVAGFKMCITDVTDLQEVSVMDL